MKSVLVQVLNVVLAIAIPLASFTTGLGARPLEGGMLRRRPGLAWRSLLAVLILVPAWAELSLRVLQPGSAVAAGLLVVVLAVGIGPVGAMKRVDVPPLQARYGFELNVLILLVSLVFVPVAVAFFGWLHGRTLALGAGAVAKVVILRALVPMALGALVARDLPNFAARSRRYLGLTLNIVLLVVIAVALLATWRDLLSVGVTGWMAAAVVAAGAILIGHFLGGPEPEIRGVLAASTALRYPALALVLAQLLPGSRAVIAEVLVYVIVSLVLMGLYGVFTTAALRTKGHPAAQGA